MKKSILLFLLCLVMTGLTTMAQQPNRFEETGEGETESPKQEKAAADPNSQKTNIPGSKKRSTDFDRWRFGGNLGLQFGSVTVIDLNPRAYYLITDKWAAGAGVMYSYVRYSNNYPYRSVAGLETNNYGGQIFTWYEIFNPIILQAEFESINWERFTYFTNPSTGDQWYEGERVWNHNVFLGGGLRQSLGRGSLFVTFLYNVTYDQYNSPYSQPYVLRIGFGI
ncbi:MAG: hypothetical protein LPK46_05335 [Bacteroidota bacterium]|nr:hypothetical protein [Bacteroidota bacterium]MDX5427636.1 hypothetical protein [Bacteroidota bacterium]MDX5505544.1 hypothetical protein [Bacteroidota bacterium]